MRWLNEVLAFRPREHDIFPTIHSQIIEINDESWQPENNAAIEHFKCSRSGITHTVFTARSGPGAVLMHELPGMTKQFWWLLIGFH